MRLEGRRVHIYVNSTTSNPLMWTAFTSTWNMARRDEHHMPVMGGLFTFQAQPFVFLDDKVWVLTDLHAPLPPVFMSGKLGYDRVECWLYPGELVRPAEELETSAQDIPGITVRRNGTQLQVVASDYRTFQEFCAIIAPQAAAAA